MVLSSLTFIIASSAPNYRILIAGASEYPALNESKKLAGEKDARRLEAFFIERFNVDPNDIKVLTNPSGQEILSGIETWFREGNKGDSLIFWWAGHGCQVPYNSNTTPPELLGAIVPNDVKLITNHQEKLIDSKSVILMRELRSKFNALANEGFNDVTWFLDSCFSGSAEKGDGGPSRLLPQKATPAEPNQAAIPDDPNPTNWVYVSAGSASQEVVEIPVGAEYWGPLAYSLVSSKNQLSSTSTYQDLRLHLQAIAKRQRSSRRPEVSGATNRPLFGGQVPAANTQFPVIPPAKTVRTALIANYPTIKEELQSMSNTVQFDPLLPLLPVGQIDGIFPGTLFELRDNSGRKGEFSVTKSYASFCVLTPTSNVDDIDLNESRAHLVSVPGNYNVSFAIEPGAMTPQEQINLATKLREFPYAKIVEASTSADFVITSSYANDQTIKARDNREIAPLKEPMQMADRIIDIAKSEIFRRMVPVGEAAFEIEVAYVPLSELDSKNKSHVPTSLTFEEERAFKVRFRRSEAAKRRGSLKPGAKVYMNFLYIRPDMRRTVAFPKFGSGREFDLYDNWGEWYFLGTGNEIYPENMLPKSKESLLVYKATPIGNYAASHLFLLTDNPVDFQHLNSNTPVSSKGAVKSVLENTLAEIMLGQTLTKGPATEFQDWGMKSIHIDILPKKSPAP